MHVLRRLSVLSRLLLNAPVGFILAAIENVRVHSGGRSLLVDDSRLDRIRNFGAIIVSHRIVHVNVAWLLVEWLLEVFIDLIVIGILVGLRDHLVGVGFSAQNILHRLLVHLVPRDLLILIKPVSLGHFKLIFHHPQLLLLLLDDFHFLGVDHVHVHRLLLHCDQLRFQDSVRFVLSRRQLLVQIDVLLLFIH